VYFRLDETGAGPFVDQIAGNNATTSGTIVSGASLLVTDTDASAVFDPATTLNKATTSYIINQQTFSVEFWCKPASLTGSGSGGESIVVSALPSAGTSGWECAYVDSTGVWRCAFNGVAFYAFASAVKAQIGVKQHIVFVFTVSTVELFVNGASQGTVAIGTIVAPGGTVVIGGSNFSSNVSRAQATIDEVAVYKNALSAARIAAHFTIGTTPQSSINLLRRGFGPQFA
jgi:hypothetical protein